MRHTAIVSFFVLTLMLVALSCQLVTQPGDTPPSTPTSAPLPDLVLLSPAYALRNAECLEQGAGLGVRVTVMNKGGATAGGFVVRVDGEEQSVIGLEPEGKVTLFFAEGQSTPEIVIDATEIIAESDEENNSFSGPLPIPTPPLPCTPEP